MSVADNLPTLIDVARRVFASWPTAQQLSVYPAMQEIKLIGERRILYPFLMCCYLGMEASVEQLLQWPCVESWCEEWRNRPKIPDSYSDVYDMNIWNELLLKFVLSLY